MYTHPVRVEFGERNLFCIGLGLMVGCFSEPPPVSGDASGEAASTAAMGTEGDSSEGATSTPTSTPTGAEAGSDSGSSGTDTINGTGSTGTDGFGTADTGTGFADTGVGTGSDPDCTTIYLNFGGVTLSDGPEDDATQNISSIGFPELLGPALQGFAGDADAVADAVSDHVEAFNVCVVTQRPDRGDYEMIVVTDSPPPLQFVTALSPAADCGNSNPHEISFVFSSGGGNVALAASSRIGFHIGLENGGDPADIMGPAGHPGPEFLETCTMLDNPPPACGNQHAEYCEAGGQNSFRELLDAFGPSIP